MKTKILVTLVVALVLLTVSINYFFSQDKSSGQNNNNNNANNAADTNPPTGQSRQREDVQIIAEDLNIPWEIALLPTGEYLVTERPGNLLKIGQNRQVITIEGVEEIGEGGLLGLAVHPQFVDNSYIYLYLTSIVNGAVSNRVERYRLNDDNLSDRQIIIDDIRGSAIHDGGRIDFGPDGYLYITTGDAGRQNLAQDRDSLNGKILRVTDEGEIPVDNPFSNAVFAMGIRNSQGLAWDPQGRLWITDHGPSGASSGYDEINLIEKGANYGWPLYLGSENAAGFRAPAIQSGATTTWAPAGAAFYDNSLFFGGLRGEALYEARIEGGRVTEVIEHFKGPFGRIRAVVLGPDDYLYISTSNRDGRGEVREGDDKIIKIDLRSL